MKTKSGLIFSIMAGLLLCTHPVYAANTLYLPRLFSSFERATTGIALMNPAATTASVTFTWRSTSGEVMATAQRTVPGKGQASFLLSELFLDALDTGWLTAEASVDQVSAFWLGGDFVTSTDGAPLVSAANAIAYPAITSLSSTSEVSFANVASTTLTGNLRLWNAAGSNVTSFAFSVPPFAVFQNTVEAMFPNHFRSFDSEGYWISVASSTSSAQVVGTVITRNHGRDISVTNAVFTGHKQSLFPHVVEGAVGGATYTSLLVLTNYNSSPVDVTLSLRQSSGAQFVIQKTVPRTGVLRSSIASLFGVSVVNGWLNVESSEAIAGVLTYTDITNGGSAAVAMHGTSDTALIFGHIADLQPWWTGIALANPSNIDAQVEVYALDSSGGLVGGPAQSARAAFTLPAQSKTAFLLGDVIPQSQSRGRDGGYVYIRSVNGVPVYGTELFFLRSGRVYSGVPATRVGSIGFFPPGTLTGNPLPAAGGTAAATAVYTGTSDYSVKKQSFRRGDTVYLYMVTNNTTGATVDSTRTYRAAGPGGYSLVNRTFTGTTTAGAGWIYWASQTIPTTAPTGLYTYTGTHEWNGVVSTLTTSFRVENDIGISGTIFTEPTESYPFESPLGGASIVIVANEREYTATTDANGRYGVTLPLSVADQSTHIIMQVSASGHVPQAVAVDLGKGSQTVSATLNRTNASTIVIETPLHHLGDSIFGGGGVNAGLQRRANEGLTFTRNFTVTSAQLPPTYTSATLKITVAGSEASNPVQINGTTIARLNNTAGAPQTFLLPFPISTLRDGTNTIVFRSVIVTTDYDDFEFSNVSILLSR